jgi:glycosyltransferase involved in cell wall biosynthesis
MSTKYQGGEMIEFRTGKDFLGNDGDVAVSPQTAHVKSSASYSVATRGNPNLTIGHMFDDKLMQSVCVVIPCYKVKNKILDVLSRIDQTVAKIIVVDDACPEGTGRHVEKVCSDARVQVIYHQENKGVGGAMISGYREALKHTEIAVVVKLDGDGQMDPALIPKFVRPILSCSADYTKGNRFYRLEDLRCMPRVRLVGNALLSFVAKVVSGYWGLMDPTNGYTAIHRDTLMLLALDKIDERYFFESDMLFRLGTIRALVKDIPMPAIYEDEVSSLNIRNAALEFPPKYLSRLLKRLFYNYFLRDFNIASIMLLASILSVTVGTLFGAYHWYVAVTTGRETPLGTIMVPTLMVTLGFQMFLYFLQQDVLSTPKQSHRV